VKGKVPRVVGDAARTAAMVVKLLWEVDPRSLIISTAGSIVGLLSSVLLLVFVRATLEVIAGKSTAVLGVAGLIGVIALQQLVTASTTMADTILRQTTAARLTSDLLTKLEQVPFQLFEDNSFQAEYGLMVREATYRPAMMIDAIVNGGSSLLSLVGILVGLALTTSPLVLLVLAVIAPSIWLESHFRHHLMSVQTVNSPQLLRMQLLSYESVDAAWQRDLRVYNSSLLRAEYMRLTTSYVKRLRDVLARLQLGSIGVACLETVGFGVLVGGTVVLLKRGVLTPIAATIIVTGLYLAVGQSRSFVTSIGSLVDSIGYADKLRTFLEKDFRLAIVGQGASAEPADAAGELRRISLEDVSFTYPSGRRPALDRVSCQLDVGLTAVVGPNGAGKSTLIRILSGLAIADRGRAESVDSLGQRAPVGTLRKAVLFQNPTHFRFTVRQNVTMAPDEGVGPPDAETRIETALSKAGMWDIVQELPEGLDTPLGGGFGGFTDLSGGQWQRLSVARLIFQDAPLVLLDEPAASLDRDGEAELMRILKDRALTHIVIVVTHRYETAIACDRVIVLADGQVVEDGTPRDLAADGTKFFSMFLSRP
jgi:ABC-type multidrug transport system fused ATPase/permease subunit